MSEFYFLHLACSFQKFRKLFIALFSKKNYGDFVILSKFPQLIYTWKQCGSWSSLPFDPVYNFIFGSTTTILIGFASFISNPF